MTDVRTKRVKDVEHCDSCGICIGEDYMERASVQVGQYRLCGTCLKVMAQKGCVELDGRQHVANMTLVDFLHPDGKVVKMRLVEKRGKGFYFEPYIPALGQ